MKWKRIKCFLTGGHRLYDKNLQTIHDTNGYHFINYSLKHPFALTTLCVKDGDKSYEGQSVGETLRMLPLKLADREIDKSWWFFNTFVITLK